MPEQIPIPEQRQEINEERMERGRRFFNDRMSMIPENVRRKADNLTFGVIGTAIGALGYIEGIKGLQIVKTGFLEIMQDPLKYSQDEKQILLWFFTASIGLAFAGMTLGAKGLKSFGEYFQKGKEGQNE